MSFLWGLLGYGYMVVVASLFGRRGFQWSWFLAVTIAAIALTLLLVPDSRSFGIDFSARRNGGLEQLVLVSVAMFFAYPLPGGLSILVDRRVPAELPAGKRRLLRFVVYFGVYTFATIVAAFVLAMLRPHFSPVP